MCSRAYHTMWMCKIGNIEGIYKSVNVLMVSDISIYMLYTYIDVIVRPHKVKIKKLRIAETNAKSNGGSK